MATAPSYVDPQQIIAPDIAAQRLALQRQQQTADILRQQSLEPMPQGHMAGAYYAAPSWTQGLAKMLQSYVAKSSQEDIDQQNLGLAKDYGDRMGALFGGGTTSPATASTAALLQGSIQQPSAPDGTGEMVSQGGVGPSPQNASRMATMLSQGAGTASRGGGLTLPGMDPKMALTSYSMDPSAYMSSFLKQYDPTEMQRNDRYLGIDTPQSKQLYLAKALKEGTQSLIPNQTNIGPDGTRTVAPDFAAGTYGGFGADGSPTMTAIPGAASILSNKAGAIKSAELAATDKFALPTPVDIRGGPVAMTPTQQRSMANGGTDPAYPAEPNITSSLKGSPDAIREQIANFKDPQDRANAQAAYAKQTAQAAQPSQPGIPLRSDVEKAREAAGVKQETQPQLERDTKIAADMAEYEKNLNGHVSESQALLQRIGQSRDALTRFKAGGGSEFAGNIAGIAQALHMPNSVVDNIAGGDLSAMQEFQKYAAQEALQTMQQALANDSGKSAQGNRISMQLFIKNNPNIDTDPRAIEKIFNFQTQLHNNLLDQSNEYQKYKTDHPNDTSAFPNMWANDQIRKGVVNPEIKTGYAKGVPPSVQSVLDKYPPKK